MPVHKSRRLFLFDLDGTLIDSKLDITLALNLALKQLNLPPLPLALVGEFVGEGVQKLIERALCAASGTEPGPEQIRIAAALYLREYEQHLLDSTRLLDGVEVALDRLSWALFAVVTNKPERFSRRILDGLGVGRRFSAIIGGDSVAPRKPAPEPLIKAMDLCGVPPSQTVMVGDSAVDISAGKAAGVLTCGVLGGFRSRIELEAAVCDLIIVNLAELADHFVRPEWMSEKIGDSP